MVKIRTATYLPRLAVGASSEVAANAVSSLMPAPTPAIDMPPINGSVMDLPMLPVIQTDEDIHGVSCRTDYHSEHNQERSKQSNVSPSHEI